MLSLAKWPLVLGAIGMWVLTADASGVNLAWDSCGPQGVTNKDFACNSDAGVDTFVVSFAVPAGTGPVIGASAVVWVQTMSGDIPSWWDFSSGGCRSSSAAAVFSGESGAGCSTLAPADSGWYYLHNGPPPEPSGIGDLHLSVAWNPLGTELVPEQEYLAFRFALDHAKTVDNDSCGGCSNPISISIIQFHLILANSTDVFLVQPLRQTSVSWQRSLVPANATSWGRIKRLYR